MVDTVRTLSYLLASVFQDGQSGGISANDMRDLCVTTASWASASGRTLVALDVSIVTTGGTAVTALTAGHRTAGGWIKNPETATFNLGINEIGTATGTSSSGSTTFITPGETYVLAASGNAVSVISADSSHAFSGMGFQ
jgi:hypothetical protein